MTELFRSAASRIVGLALLALVLGAVLITAVRLVLPLADRYQDRLTALVSERIGYSVRVGGLSVGLAGWRLRLTLDDAVLSDPDTGAPVLSLRALQLDLDAMATLRNGSPQIRALTMLGARLTVRRLADGRVELVGLGALAGQDPRGLELFLGKGRVELADSEVRLEDETRGGAVLRLTDLSLELDNQRARHRLHLSARLRPADVPNGVRAELWDAERPHDARLTLTGRLAGPPDDTTSWRGLVYARLQGSNLAQLLPQPIQAQVQFSTGSVRWESWNRIRGGALVQSLNRVDLQGLVAAVAGHGAMSIERVAGLVRARPQDPGWLVQLADLRLDAAGGALQDLDLDLLVGDAGRGPRLALEARRLDLDDLGRVIAEVPLLPPRVASQIVALRPRGQVQDLSVRIEQPPAKSARWRASALFQDLGMDRSAHVPGFDGLTVGIAADQDGGRASLASERLGLDLHPLFDRPLCLDRFSGRLDWARDADGALRVSGRNLTLENEDIGGRARFAVEIPVDGDPPLLDLRASLHDADGASIRPYLPVGIMSTKLETWLERAIVSGRVPRTDLVFRGPLAGYPFRDREGRFELLLDFEDATLDYLDGWPRVDSADGSLHFVGSSMDVGVDSGRILNSAITAARASIEDLQERPVRLSIHGETQGPFNDGLRLLGETPLSSRFGRLAEKFAVTGDLAVALDLDVQLKSGLPPAITGLLTWPGPAELAIKGTPIALSGLDGELGFTTTGLKGESIGAQLWGAPVRLAIETLDGGNPNGAETRVEAASRTPIKELARNLPSPVWALATGDLDWRLTAHLSGRKLETETFPVRYELASDLVGTALDLPPPFGKASGPARNLALSGTLVPGRSLTIAGAVDGLGLNLELSPGPPAMRLVKGRVRFGKSPAPPADADGLTIDGALDELDPRPWADWWGRMLAAVPVGTGRSGAGPATALRVEGLRAARLQLGRAELTEARIDATSGSEGLDLELSSETVAGRFRSAEAGSGAPAKLELERLDLAAFAPGTDPPEAAASERPGGSMERIPPMDVRVADLRWGDTSLGRLSLDLRPDVAGIRVPTIELSGSTLVTASGEGVVSDSNGAGRSRVAVDVQAPDTGELLRALGYSTALAEAPLGMSLRLDWPGGLEAFALRHADGSIDTKVGAGRLLDVEPGVGRVLGFMNLGALGRRLSLDFSDLYQQGFAFERIDGRIRIGGGKASFETFAIDGPAGDVTVEGSSDLAEQTLDQTVTVVPRIGSSVALASAFAGGPVVGAAVLLVDRVAGGAIDRLGSYRYRVTGPWREPVLERVGWEPRLGRDGAGSGAAGADGADGGKGPASKAEPDDTNLFLH